MSPNLYKDLFSGGHGKRLIAVGKDLSSGGRVRIIGVIGVVLVAFALGYYLAGDKKPGAPVSAPGPQAAVDKSGGTGSDKHDVKPAKTGLWTCSMHPQIRLPHPGKCPICFMDLIPLESETVAEAGPGEYAMSAAAKKLAEVETTEVKRGRAKVIVRMVGLVFEDETRIAALTSRVEGRLDRIYVNFTGERVNKGDPMVTVWSPTLIKSQVELFESIKSGAPDQSVSRSASFFEQFGVFFGS